MVEIDNESSLLEAWERGNLDRYALGDYKTELQKQWNVFLRSNYGTTEALRSAWGELAEGQPLDKDQVALVGNKESGPQKRLDDYLLFLTDRDRAGSRMTPLGDKDIRRIDGGYGIHVQCDGQALSPWYELIAERRAK